MTLGNPHSLVVEVLLPGALDHGFDYAAPEGMALAAGDVVRVPLGSRESFGVVWGAGTRQGVKLKTVTEKIAHVPPMGEAMRKFVEWAAWYTCSPKGAVLKMCLAVPDALKSPTARERPPLAVFSPPQPVVLSGDQLAAAEALAAKLGAGFSVTLLDGVTGSGKTEVYFDAMAKLLQTEAQVLVLLPEISLSVQWLARFERRFGFLPHIWHSGLPPGRRKHTWRAVADGSARVVVGARSALFLPYRKLQMIVADEEHDSSYKQEDGVIYHARDMAVARARFEQFPAVLVSATPSLETWNNVRTEKYAALHLHARHAGASLPDITMIDMRTAGLERGAFLSGELRKALAETFARGEQSMLFLNRRGYAPLTLCRACGHRFQCPQCTAWLVMHKTRPRLQCHHCGYVLPLPKECPECKAEDTLYPCGPGVERIAEEVAALFPQARVGVLASDHTETYDELQTRILAMERGEIDILIGTQMMAKGHHFAGLALVGVVDADLGLAGGDLRAAERTYQLLHQISGRAGREHIAGKVLIQSFAPDHPVMKALVAGDRATFMALELTEREAGQMPPFSRLAAVIVEAVHEDQAASLAKALARAAPKAVGVQVLGPAPAPLYMLRGKYRQRLLVRARRELNLQHYVSEWLSSVSVPRSVRVKVDIDPYSFL